MRLPLSDRLILLALIALDLALVCCWLGRNELSGDEPFTLFHAQRPLRDLWAMLRHENNPPLYFLLMHAWSPLVGLDVAWLRVPSALFSALCVWPLFLLGHRLAGRTVAITATLLFLFCNHHFLFAHEVRAYSLFTLLSIASMWSLVRRMNDPARSFDRRSLAAVVINVLLVYTHFFGWLMVGVELIAVLVLPELMSLRKSFFIMIAMVAVTYLPYALVFTDRMSTTLEHGTWVKIHGPEEIWNMVWRWSNQPVIAFAFLIAALVAWVRGTGTTLLFRLSALWGLFPLLALWLAQWVAPAYVDRYLVWAAPGFCLLVAGSLSRLIRAGRWSIVPPVLGCAVMAFTFTPWKENGLHPSEVLKTAERWRTPTGAVLLQPDYYDLPYAFALDPHLFRTPDSLRPRLLRKRIVPVQDPASLHLDSAWHEVILVDAWASLVDPQRVLVHRLLAQWPLVDSIQADRTVRVFRYRRSAGP